MRSISSKFIVAIMLTSIVSIGVLALFGRLSTSRQFDQLIEDQFKEDLIAQLSSYYAENGSWAELEVKFGMRPDHHWHMMDDKSRPLFFTIADTNGVVIVAGYGYDVGDVIAENDLEQGSKIILDGVPIGILFINNFESPADMPMRTEFFRRLDASLFLIVLGAVAIAIVVGVLLSRNITRPVRELTAATRQMANGNLNQQVPVRSNDEIGELATSFNKMSNDLAHSFNIRKQMTADIAHELRTPLSLIIGHAEAVHDKVLEPTLENFEIIREEAQRLEKLVNDLRTLSLADAGELSVEFQLVDVQQLLSDIHAHYNYQFNQKRVELKLEPVSVMLKANLDPSRFSQVLMNILDNALRHTPAGGQVSISTTQQKDTIQISIQDNGSGVSSEEAARLFDRFYRADESRARDEGGSGLGLAIAKSIIEMHKGKIWAKSEIGQGLRVVIEIPKG